MAALAQNKKLLRKLKNGNLRSYSPSDLKVSSELQQLSKQIQDAKAQFIELCIIE